LPRPFQSFFGKVYEFLTKVAEIDSGEKQTQRESQQDVAAKHQ